MKVYVAAPWVCKDKARNVGRLLTAAGFEITEEWWDHPEVPGYLKDATNPELRGQAINDIHGVVKADLFILLNLQVSEGKAVETGMAILLGLPIILYGGKSNLFHYCDEVYEVDSISQILALAKSFRVMNYHGKQTVIE
jgi:nucleoside 2-deoxyribosyltransferase